MMELLGLASTAVAVTGVVLNNRRRRACFVLWMVSNSVTLAIHVSAGIWSLALRDAIFFALAVEGLILWNKEG
jgi:nicotinamide riboside transporter PnuC